MIASSTGRPTTLLTWRNMPVTSMDHLAPCCSANPDSALRHQNGQHGGLEVIG
jgi:hypothetical protein